MFMNSWRHHIHVLGHSVMEDGCYGDYLMTTFRRSTLWTQPTSITILYYLYYFIRKVKVICYRDRKTTNLYQLVYTERSWTQPFILTSYHYDIRSRDSSVGIVTDYGLDGSGFETQHYKIFLFSTASRPALGPTQPPVQSVSETRSPGVKRYMREADHSPPLSTEWMVELYLHSPTCLHGTVFN
jgi:hypothetical protein